MTNSEYQTSQLESFLMSFSVVFNLFVPSQPLFNSLLNSPENYWVILPLLVLALIEKQLEQDQVEEFMFQVCVQTQ